MINTKRAREQGEPKTDAEKKKEVRRRRRAWVEGLLRTTEGGENVRITDKTAEIITRALKNWWLLDHPGKTAPPEAYNKYEQKMDPSIQRRLHDDVTSLISLSFESINEIRVFAGLDPLKAGTQASQLQHPPQAAEKLQDPQAHMVQNLVSSVGFVVDDLQNSMDLELAFENWDATKLDEFLDLSASLIEELSPPRPSEGSNVSSSETYPLQPPSREHSTSPLSHASPSSLSSSSSSTSSSTSSPNQPPSAQPPQTDLTNQFGEGEVPCTWKEGANTTIGIVFDDIITTREDLETIVRSEFSDRGHIIQVKMVYGSSTQRAKYWLSSDRTTVTYFEEHIIPLRHHLAPHLYVTGPRDEGQLNPHNQPQLSDVQHQGGHSSSSPSQAGPYSSSSPSQGGQPGGGNAPAPSQMLGAVQEELFASLLSDIDKIRQGEEVINVTKYPPEFLKHHTPTAMEALRLLVRYLPPKFFEEEESRARIEDGEIVVDITMPNIKIGETPLSNILQTARRIFEIRGAEVQTEPIQAFTKLLDDIQIQYLTLRKPIQSQPSILTPLQLFEVLRKSLQVVAALCPFLPQAGQQDKMNDITTFINDTLYNILTVSSTLANDVKAVNDALAIKFPTAMQSALRGFKFVLGAWRCTNQKIDNSSEIYRGYDLEDGYIAAVKCKTLESSSQAMWMEQRYEVLDDVLERAQRQVENKPRIVKFLTHCPRSDREYLVISAYRNAPTLRTWMQRLEERKAKITDYNIMSLVLQILITVHSLWRSHIHHCDLQPKRMMMLEGKLKVTDIGFAKHLYNRVSSTAPGKSDADKAYVAPEVIDGSLKLIDTSDANKADLYSAGAMIYELVYAQKPSANTVVVDKPGVPPALKSLIQGLMERDPAKRISYRETWTHEFVMQQLDVHHLPQLPLEQHPMEAPA